MTPEELARQRIDRQLEQSGWSVQDYRQMNISAGLGVAVREFPLKTGEADYMLYADAKAIGVVDRRMFYRLWSSVFTQLAVRTQRFRRSFEDRRMMNLVSPSLIDQAS